MLFLNSWRVSNCRVKGGTSPPAIKKQFQGKLRLNLYSLSVCVSGLLEYGRMIKMSGPLSVVPIL
jgi:hypothetical protein